MTQKYIPPPRKFNWPIPYDAVLIVAESEGLKLEAYLCPAGVWTIGRGRTRGVKRGDKITLEQADQYLLEDLTSFAGRVTPLLKRACTPNQFGALVSLAYNIGIGSADPKLPGGLTRSTALARFNAGDFVGAAEAFKWWNKGTVKGKKTVLPGLVTRRAREAALFLTPEVNAAEPITHQIEQEQRPANGTAVTVAATAAATTATIGVSTEVVNDQPSIAIDPTAAATFGIGAVLGALATWLFGGKKNV